MGEGGELFGNADCGCGDCVGCVLEMAVGSSLADHRPAPLECQEGRLRSPYFLPDSQQQSHSASTFCPRGDIRIFVILGNGFKEMITYQKLALTWKKLHSLLFNLFN